MLKYKEEEESIIKLMFVAVVLDVIKSSFLFVF